MVAAPGLPAHQPAARPTSTSLDVLNQPADASYVLTQVLALDAEPATRCAAASTPTGSRAAGHSAGGITTIGLFSGGRDDRLDAGIVLAGSGARRRRRFTGPAAPLLFVHGDADQVVPYAAGQAAFDAVPWPKAMLTLPERRPRRRLQRERRRASTWSPTRPPTSCAGASTATPAAKAPARPADARGRRPATARRPAC